MYFKQILDERCGCASYLIASRQSQEAAIVDPAIEIAPVRGAAGGARLPASLRDRHARPRRPRLRRAQLAASSTAPSSACTSRASELSVPPLAQTARSCRSGS